MKRNIETKCDIVHQHVSVFRYIFKKKHKVYWSQTHSMAIHTWLLIRNHLIANMEKIVTTQKAKESIKSDKKIVSNF